MTEADSSLRDEFENVAEQAQAMAFLPRAAEFQEQACQDIDRFLARLREEKKRRVTAKDETEANTILAMELSLRAVLHELKMYLALKRDDGDSAWDHLVSSQGAAETALSVRRQLTTNSDKAGLDNYLEKLNLVEKLLFPPQVFMSVAGKAGCSECSICHDSYEDCNHIKGRAYIGEVCSRIVHELDLGEVSLVTNPANKRCRATHFSDGDRMRNRLTWRLEKGLSSDNTSDV